ncbi:Sodium/hydrogen exchanger 9B2 [Dissostichus eleginoides]|uniref:Sodium/hydrogen exchanger 9B2 n=1 Tax=Dissostichus eleginoides TaxID=100907 RepID=A0AAD9F5M1_DISEL|nr:Sodium/hydrogen exchanger 9B2 [Dissostichus eleginoides]
MVTDQLVSGRRRWLHVHPERREKGTALQGRLEKRSHACHSRRRVSVLCSREECGRRPAAGLPPLRQKRILGDVVSRQKRILGGRVSRKGAWPWQCSLQSGPSGHVCGCVLIGRRWALTVAHCFEGREGADLWKVVLGLNNLDHPGGNSQTRGVKSIVVHPRYNRAVVDYDISVVQLDSEIEETEFVRPCQSYFDMKTITPRMLCAGYEAGTVDSCMGDSGGPLGDSGGPLGDSGGPLVCSDSSGRWTLFGLTSWGSVCFSKVLGPGVYSNVTHFTSWIQQQIYTHTYLTVTRFSSLFLKHTAKMMDEESTKRYLRASEDAQKQTQEDIEITVLPRRTTDELDEQIKMADSCCSSCIRLKNKCPRPRGLLNLVITKGSECLPGGNLFGLVVLFLCSVLGGKLVGLIQLPTLPPFPPLLGMLLAGLLLRNVPYVTDAVYIDTHWSAALRNIALAVILTRAGLGLDPSALSRLKAVCVRLAVGPCVVEASVVAVVSHFLLGLPWVWGFILGFVLAAVSPAVVVPSMLLLQKEGLGVEKGIPTLLMAAGSFDDILAITGFSTCLGITFSTGAMWMNILKGLLEVLGGVIAGLILGLFLCCFPSNDQEDLVLTRTILLLGLSIFSVFFSHVIGFAGAGGLSTLVLAFLAALGWKTEKAPVAAMVGRSWDVFQPLLFGLIGAEIRIASLSPSTVGFNLKEKIFISVAWLPKATVQAAIGSKALDMAREEGDETLIKFGLDVLTAHRSAGYRIGRTAPPGPADDAEGGATDPSRNMIGQEKVNTALESKL